MNRWIFGCACLLVFSCTPGCASLTLTSDSREPTQLIVVAEYPISFQTKYVPTIAAQLPELSVRLFSPEDWEAGKDTDASPDLMIVSYAHYERLIRDGMLRALDMFVSEREFDLEALHPGVTQLLTAPGAGTLYGLTPEFSSQAIVYNIELFDRYGVPYPVEGMSWDEVLDLADRFPGGTDEDAVYGLYTWQSGYELTREIGRGQGLVAVTKDDVFIAAPSWNHIWTRVVSGVRQGTIFTSPQHPGTMTVNDNAFTGGRAAMTVAGLTQLTNSQAASLRVGVVPPPVNPEEPNVNPTLRIHDIFVIPAHAAHADAAWSLIELIHGKQYAKVRSGAPTGTLTRMDAMPELEGIPLDAFYRPTDPPRWDGDERRLSPAFLAEFDTLGAEAFETALGDGTSADEALASFQAQALEALQRTQIEQ